MPKESTPCIRCGKPGYPVWPCDRAKGKGKYCSTECYDIHRLKPEDDIWTKYTVVGDCWVWNRGRSAHGYGSYFFRGKQMPAHRAAFELTYGPVPEGLYVCHICDNPPCINPEHLFLGTHGDNARDRVKKGRNNATQGTKRPGAKMDDAKVRDAWTRTVLLHEPRAKVAADYGVCEGVILRIALGRGWKHVTSPLFAALNARE